MTLQYIEDVVSLLDEWALNRNSLKSLKIRNCPRLTPLFRVVPYLTSLVELKIGHCKEFNSLNDIDDDEDMDDDDDIKWRCLNCLNYLYV